MSKSDNRKGPRIDVRIPAKVFLENRKVDVEILNLSEGGAYVHCDVDWKVGQSVKVEIQFRGTVLLAGKTTTWENLRGKSGEKASIEGLPTDMSAQTVIRWKLTEKDEYHPPGFGVEFTEVQGQHKTHIQKILRYYDNLKKAGVSFG